MHIYDSCVCAHTHTMYTLLWWFVLITLSKYLESQWALTETPGLEYAETEIKQESIEFQLNQCFENSIYSVITALHSKQRCQREPLTWIEGWGEAHDHNSP